jgi:hypothetical protein
MRTLVIAAFLTAAVFGQDAPKNVQILVGETPLQLQRNMNLMRAALGVHCDYCHVNTEEKGWNFGARRQGDQAPCARHDPDGRRHQH